MSPKNTYNISAAGPGQGAAAQVTITVNLVPVNAVSYGAAGFTFTAGIPAQTLTPITASGVSATAWSIAPQLPAGLTFNGDGSISGTPTVASPATPYKVMAQSSSGALSTTFTIEVDDSVLVDLGHSFGIRVMAFNGSSVLTTDDLGHWVLWNYATAAIIANGDSDCIFNTCPVFSQPLPNIALAGPTAVIETKSGFELLSATTGAVTANIASSQSWWLLAPDGSYLVTGGSHGISVWSPAGQLLLSHPGDYSGALAVASPGAVRIARGPAGTNVIETLSVPGGADSVSSTFIGQFSSWFVDGSAFFSVAGSTELIYSNAVVQEAQFPAPVNPLSGMGQWLWNFTDGDLALYALAAPATAVASYPSGNSLPIVVPSGSTLGVIYNYPGNTVSVIDLSGAAPIKVDYNSPLGQGGSFMSAYAASSSSHWLIAFVDGVLVDGPSLAGTPRFFGYGQALSVAGSAGEIVVATASGSLLYFDAATLAQQGAIGFPSGQLALSADGSLLAAAPNQTGNGIASASLNIYSMPSASLLYSWPYPASSNTTVGNVSLSGSGKLLGQVLFDTAGTTQQASAPTGGAPVYSVTFSGAGPLASPPPLQLSPDGTLIATSISGDPDVPISPTSAAFETNIIQNGSLVASASGWPAGWIDNGNLLVNSYQVDRFVSSQTNYTGCTVLDPLGANTGAACLLPDVLSFQTVTSDTLYARNLNEIVSVSTGSVSWKSGNALTPSSSNTNRLIFLDALAGSRVVFVSGSRVVAQAH